MGEVISLAARRQARRPSHAHAPAPRRRAAEFIFDLTSPYTYLAAERIERLFDDIVWRPALADALYAGNPLSEPDALELHRAAAEQRAAALRMPIVWPERYPTSGRAAMRVCSVAAEYGRSAAFVLAAGRLAFCGGFDLDDPEIIAEAAAAACLPLEPCLRAAGDRTLDGELEAAGRRLLAQGADRLPVVRVGRMLFCGEDRLSEAAACAAAATGSAGTAPGRAM